ncbi:TPA: hypothetical protein ACG3HB_003482 [Clostridioides difficile]|nr:hypothetical protein [Clostridioides difficile]
MGFFKKSVVMLASALLLTTGTSFASDLEVSKTATTDEILSKIESIGAKNIYEGGGAFYNDDEIPNLNLKNNETAVIHNNGNPMNTNIFEEKQGNELFAIVVSNINGNNVESYYISDTETLMDTTLDGMVNDISNGKLKDVYKNDLNKQSRNSIKTYKWDFYRNLVTGKIQTGSLYTQLDFSKAGNYNVDGKNSSIWNVVSRSDVKARSDDRINNTYVRLDAGVGSQKLHDYTPQTTNASTLELSLTKLLNPKLWTISAGGYTTKSLSPGLESRYGRWEFKSRIGKQNYWVTAPGIRASNSKGNFAIKYSQTMKLNYSEHQTGVISASVSDR